MGRAITRSMIATWKHRAKMRALQQKNWQGIPKFAIDKFMNRKRKNFRVYKRMTPKEILVQRNRLPIRPPIWNELSHLQRVCLVIGAKTKRFAFLNDTGTGKTFLSIALIRYFLKLGSVKQVLVLVPNRVNKYEWSKQIKKHSPSTTICVLHGSSVNKWDQLTNNDAMVTVETFGGFVRMVSKRKDHKKKKGKKQLVLNVSLMNKIKKKFQGLICDESTKIKNRKSLPYRACRYVSKEMEIAFTLTGTPFGRNPIDLWSQMYLIDKGETLGQSMGLFRAAFFEKKDDFFAYKYEFDKSKRKRLHRFLANRSIRYVADENDLPRLVPDVKKVFLPQTAAAYYDAAVASIKKAKGNYIECRNAFMRMRQISSGFIGFKDDLFGKSAQVELPDNPKLEMLLSIIENTDPKTKIIVFHEYHYSSAKICAELKKRKISHVLVNGKTKDSEQALKDFEREVRVLVLNNNAGGYGLNLQHSQMGIYYESPVSSIDRKQTLARFYRQHSKFKYVNAIDLVTEGTVDETILENHKAARKLLRAIVDGHIDLTRKKRSSQPKFELAA